MLVLTNEGREVRRSSLESLARSPGPVDLLRPDGQRQIADALALIGAPCETFPLDD